MANERHASNPDQLRNGIDVPQGEVAQEVNTSEHAKKVQDVMNKRILSPEKKDDLIKTLKNRFEANMNRHPEMQWETVEARLNNAAPEKLWSLNEMERTGGEPDVVDLVEETGEIEFWDCSKESPKGRRNLRYGKLTYEYGSPAQWISNSVMRAIQRMALGGLLNKDQYQALQTLGAFDTESQSWLNTPQEVVQKEELALIGGLSDGKVELDYEHTYKQWSDLGFRGWLRV